MISNLLRYRYNLGLVYAKLGKISAIISVLGTIWPCTVIPDLKMHRPRGTTPVDASSEATL